MDDVSRAEGAPGDDPTWLSEEIGASPTVLIAPLGAAIQSAEIDGTSGAADDDIDGALDESGSSTEQERPSGGWWRRFTSGPLWHHADFRRLWVGDTASQLGVAVGGLAIPYLAVHILAATEFQMGLLATLTSLGFLLVALPAGAWVDRWRKRHVMLRVDVGRALLLLTVPVAWWFGVLTMAQVFVVATAVGVLTVFFDVSYQSYLPFLVGREHVVEGNSKLQASQSVSTTVGPTLGGFLIRVFGPIWVVVINSLGYLASAFALGRIRHEEIPKPVEDRLPLTTEIREGLAFVVKHPLLRRLVACTGISNFGGAIFGALSVLYMLRFLHFGAGTIGLIDSVGAIGGFIGATLSTKLAKGLGEGPLIIYSALAFQAFALMWPLSWLFWPEPVLLAGTAALGVAVVVYNVATVSFRQRLCPPQLLGRMNASARFLVWGTIPLGSFIGGILGTAIGVIPTLWIGVIVGFASVLPVVFSPLWGMRTLPEHEEPDDVDRSSSVA
jgi:predicted MFS family arabinose efflux permease